jgi:hypothetical protein
MIADPGHAPVPRELPASTWPTPVEISKTSTLVARRMPTGRECGLGPEAAVAADTRCRDSHPRAGDRASMTPDKSDGPDWAEHKQEEA